MDVGAIAGLTGAAPRGRAAEGGGEEDAPVPKASKHRRRRPGRGRVRVLPSEKRPKRGKGFPTTKGYLRLMLRAMEPGAWYARPDLREACAAFMSYDYVKRYVIAAWQRGFLERGDNPEWPGGTAAERRRQRGRSCILPASQYLYRLTEAGLAHREQGP